MAPLFGYVLILAVGFLWLTLDAETIYIFDVYGKNFYYVWFESGQRLKHLLIYGWRLLALCLLVTTAVVLAHRALFTSGDGARDDWTNVTFVAMVSVALAMIPWIYVVQWIRWRRYLRRLALYLTAVAERISTSPDLSASMQQAEYIADAGWSAWYFSTLVERPQIVPVAYVHAAPVAAVVFPIDWTTFLAWRLSELVPAPSVCLPFRGPQDSSFVVESVKPLRGVPEWSVIRAKLQLDQNSAYQPCV